MDAQEEDIIVEGRLGDSMYIIEDGSGFPLFLRFSIGKCRKCPFFRAF